MRTAEPHINFPLAAYPDRPYDWSVPYDRELEDSLGPAPSEPDPVTAYPYDWAGPYDWAVEGVFDESETAAEPAARPNIYLDTLSRMKGLALAGVAMTAAVVAMGYGSYMLKKEFFALDADNVPGKLPKPVRDVADSAVKVEYNTDLDHGLSGSGVKIGPDLVLTAGHVVQPERDPPVLSCQGSYVLNVITADYDWPVWIRDRSYAYGGSEDMAVLRVRDDYSFDALPTARIAEEQPGKGESVFFINYESGRRYGDDHYPNAELAAQTEAEAGAEFYGHAAQYAGIVIGHEGSDLVVATGQKGYGPEAGREVNTYPGGSGGPVFNQDGELIGEVVSSTVGSNEWVVMEHEINVPHRGSGIELSYVRPVTRELVDSLVAGLPETTAC
jgi:hypothetical protein